MAEIKNIKFSAKISEPGGNNWRITVNYDAVFAPFEVNNHFHFRDSFRLWEDDTGDVFGPSPDALTGWVGTSNFTATGHVVARELSTIISGDHLDSELSDEELYVRVRLQNRDLSVWADPGSNGKKSGILHLEI